MTQPGTLYLIPISLGESEVGHYQPADNVQLIERLDRFVVENARTARHYIKAVSPNRVMAELTIYEIDKHNGYTYPNEVMADLLAGYDMGLMSEAGCPAVADPGSKIVAEAHRRGIPVRPLVGPSSILLSLMASGFNGQRFAFHGYLPIDDKARKSSLSDMQHRLSSKGETQIFIETPYRNDRLIEELTNTLPADFSLCVAVDLTTAQEEIHSHTIREWRSLRTRRTFHKRPAIFLLGRS